MLVKITVSGTSWMESGFNGQENCHLGHGFVHGLENNMERLQQLQEGSQLHLLYKHSRAYPLVFEVF